MLIVVSLYSLFSRCRKLACVYVCMYVLLGVGGRRSRLFVVPLTRYSREQDEPEKADRCHEGHPQVVGDKGKGHGLRREPDRPILQQKVVVPNVRNVLVQTLLEDSFRDRIVVAVHPRLDKIRGRQPHNGCSNQIVKEDLRGGDGDCLFGPK